MAYFILVRIATLIPMLLLVWVSGAPPVQDGELYVQYAEVPGLMFYTCLCMYVTRPLGPMYVCDPSTSEGS